MTVRCYFQLIIISQNLQHIIHRLTLGSPISVEMNDNKAISTPEKAEKSIELQP